MGGGVPTASAVTTRTTPTLQHNSVQHRTDSQINPCNRDWKMHCANFRNLHFSTNMGTSQSEDAHCIRAGNVPLNQSSSEKGVAVAVGEVFHLRLVIDASEFLSGAVCKG